MSSRRDLPQPFNLAKSINSLHYSSSGEIIRLVDEVIGSGFAGVTTNNLCLIGDSASDLSARREHTDDQQDPALKKQERELDRQVSIRDSRRNEKTNLEKGADGSCVSSFCFDDGFRNYDEHLSQMSVGHDKSPGFPWPSTASVAFDITPLSKTSHPGFERSANEWPANSEPRLSRRQSGKVTDTSLLSCDATEFSATASLEPSIRSLPQFGHLGTGATCSMTARSLALVVPRPMGEDNRAEPNITLKKGISSAPMASPTPNTVADRFSNSFTSHSTSSISNEGQSCDYDPYCPEQNKHSIPQNPRCETMTDRFTVLGLEDQQGGMYALSKDKSGCRHLQMKLEENNPEHRDLIFQEIFPHFSELMTHTFGNFLSQKLFQSSSNEQRDALLDSISGELVSIALNMHGTRAVQKIIDHLSTRRQVQSLVAALNLNVIVLIQDSNGNRVIQKCLNQLPSEDNQFIYNAVSANCIEVATDRYGSRVLQLCIDHGTESQRTQLMEEIKQDWLALAQDRFGNYTVQRCLDLSDGRFMKAIVRRFLGKIRDLSVQKFSSNVVEKCIRVADPIAKRAIIDEILADNLVNRLLLDDFGNYVCQTALELAEPDQRAMLIHHITPILSHIRHTPHGRRIQSKITRENIHHMNRGGRFHHGLTGGHTGLVGISLAPFHQLVPGHHIHPSR